jgi:hypothetical protein
MKTGDQRNTREQRVAWFKWEFLRRNSLYKQDQLAFQNRFEPWFELNGYWWDRKAPIYTEDSWHFFCGQIAPAAKAICERWNITDPFPPSWDFDANCTRLERGSTLFIPTLDRGHSWDLPVVDPGSNTDAESEFDPTLRYFEETENGFADTEESWKDAEDIRFVRVEIDITKPLKRINAIVEREVGWARRIFENTVGSLPKIRKRSRIRLSDYEICLQVWKLREKGLTFPQIAALMFPNENRIDDVERNAKRVRTQYNRARELIETGYQQIDVGDLFVGP